MGTIKRQGIKNTLFTYLGVIIGFVNLIVLMPFVLKPDELGLIRIMYSATILFGTLYPVGINFMTIKYFPRIKNDTTKHNGYLGLLLLISLIGFLLAAFLVWYCRDEIVSYYQKKSSMFVVYFDYVIPIGFCIGTTTILSGYLNALYKSTVPTFLNEVYIRVWMTGLVLLYFTGVITFSSLMLLYMISYLFMVVFLLLYIVSVNAFGLKINWIFFRGLPKREMTSFTLLLALASLASIGIRNLDTMMIGSMIGLEEVAVYSIAFTIATIIETPVNSLGKIADPKISAALTSGNLEEMKTIYYKSTRYMSVVGGFLFLMICANIREGLLLLPEKYHGSELVVYIVGVSAFINMATGVNTSLIYYSNNYKIGTLFLFFMILISVMLNRILIPHFGIVGAAIGTSTALLIYNALKFWLIFKKFSFQPFDFSVLKLVLLVSVLFGGGILFTSDFHPIGVILIRSTLLLLGFFIGIYLFRIDKDLIKEIRSFTWRKQK